MLISAWMGWFPYTCSQQFCNLKDKLPDQYKPVGTAKGKFF